jgi:hypothetical protein
MTNLHGWTIDDDNGKYQCMVKVGSTTYGVTDITVLDEPIYTLVPN